MLFANIAIEQIHLANLLIRNTHATQALEAAPGVLLPVFRAARVEVLGSELILLW